MMRLQPKYLYRIPIHSGILLTALLWTLTGNLDATYAWQNGTQVTIAGLSIARPKANDQFGMSQVMGRNAGIEVHLRIETSDLHIIKVAENKDKTPAISVAGGKTLAAGDRFSDIGFFSQVDEDGKAVTIPINASELPPAGTAKLQIKGEIILTTGSDPATAEQKFALKAGEMVQLGKINCELEEVNEDSFGDESATIINFKSSESLSTLQEVKFFDAAGNEIESSPAGTSSFGFGGDMTYNTNYRLVGKPTEVVAKIKYFKSTKDVPIKIDRTFGVGLDD